MSVVSRRSWTDPKLTIAVRSAFLACAVGAGAILCWRQRHEIAAALAQTSPGLLLMAFLLGLGHVALSFVVWRGLLDAPGRSVPVATAARMFFLGQVGKYLPGGIWPFLAMAEFGRDAGLTRRTTMTSQMLALLVTLCVAAAIGVATVPQAMAHFPRSPVWLIAAALPILVLLHPSARKLLVHLAGIDCNPGPRTLLGAAAMAAVMWSLAGAQLVVLSNAVGAARDWAAIIPATGAYALSWTAGFLFLVAPAGIGAREAVLVALLSAQMPVPQAIVVALLSRLGMTLADFTAAALAATAGRYPAVR